MKLPRVCKKSQMITTTTRKTRSRLALRGEAEGMCNPSADASVAAIPACE
jgi:hypothetical protein